MKLKAIFVFTLVFLLICAAATFVGWIGGVELFTPSAGVLALFGITIGTLVGIITATLVTDDECIDSSGDFYA